jgi:hypothetical protein
VWPDKMTVVKKLTNFDQIKTYVTSNEYYGQSMIIWFFFKTTHSIWRDDNDNDTMCAVFVVVAVFDGQT